MFEGLKKKFSSFIESFSKKEEEEAGAEAAKEAEVKEAVHEVKAQASYARHKGENAISRKEPEPSPEPKAITEAKENAIITQKGGHAPEPKPQHKPLQRIKSDEVPLQTGHKTGMRVQHHAEAKQEQPKVGFATKLKGAILREVSVSENDLEPFLEQLKLSLIQSDVNYDVAEKIVDNMRKDMIGRKLSIKDIDMQVTNILKNALTELLNRGSSIDIIDLAKRARSDGHLPFKILFLGPNGAGKTTTMAKIAHMFLKNGFTCLLSASDTFRAAAVEQTVHHANRLGINVIKGAYGADPASVAFDAIANAKAHFIEIVLIDSAGRQETNKSLMEEVKKMVRVAKPDLKIFVGEGIAGNALLEQVRQFNEDTGLDGVILTKLDCDAKGGNTLSVLSETSVPVLFFGIGEGYDDIIVYKPSIVISNIFGEAA